MKNRYRAPLAPPPSLWQNVLEMSRYFYFILAIAAGVGLSLLFGLIGNPVQLPDPTISGLRDDYKTDYVLMIAESYAFDGDLSQAINRLDKLEDEEPLQSVQKALIFAVDTGYTPPDLITMRDLEVAVRTWNPDPEDLP
ncbi:MAG: hypothetical protein DWQ07_14580 [Chloroflexi bacterium]|nr:MAG: hypothetical protein DWQ07_14580 [Chloroflexota bacterium]MBL1195691.1 hypothetical protein [Chloroflexota bacterium]NOH12979.1 hypothetical protein [Chloroflexota bacterium]